VAKKRPDRGGKAKNPGHFCGVLFLPIAIVGFSPYSRHIFLAMQGINRPFKEWHRATFLRRLHIGHHSFAGFRTQTPEIVQKTSTVCFPFRLFGKLTMMVISR